VEIRVVGGAPLDCRFFLVLRATRTFVAQIHENKFALRTGLPSLLAVIGLSPTHEPDVVVVVRMGASSFSSVIYGFGPSGLFERRIVGYAPERIVTGTSGAVRALADCTSRWSGRIVLTFVEPTGARYAVDHTWLTLRGRSLVQTKSSQYETANPAAPGTTASTPEFPSCTLAS
jgi:hypothetical protein